MELLYMQIDIILVNLKSMKLLKLKKTTLAKQEEKQNCKKFISRHVKKRNKNTKVNENLNFKTTALQQYGGETDL